MASVSLIKLVRDNTEKMLKTSDMKKLCDKIVTSLDKYDKVDLDKLDAFVNSQASQFNEFAELFGSHSLNKIKGGKSESNKVIVYNSEITSFDNSDADRSEKKRRIAYGLIFQVIAASISTLILFIFLRMSIEDTLGAENVNPILERLMSLNPAGLVDIVTKITTTQMDNATEDAKFHLSLLAKGNFITGARGLFQMFQATDTAQHLLAIQVSTQKINYAFTWFKYSAGVNATLIGKLCLKEGPAALTYIKNLSTKRLKVITIKKNDLFEIENSSVKTRSSAKTKSTAITKSSAKTRGGNRTKKNKKNKKN